MLPTYGCLHRHYIHAGLGWCCKRVCRVCPARTKPRRYVGTLSDRQSAIITVACSLFRLSVISWVFSSMYGTLVSLYFPLCILMGLMSSERMLAQSLHIARALTREVQPSPRDRGQRERGKGRGKKFDSSPVCEWVSMCSVFIYILSTVSGWAAIIIHDAIPIQMDYWLLMPRITYVER